MTEINPIKEPKNKFLCKKPLYWYPGEDDEGGEFMEKECSGEKTGIPVFIAGKKYEIIPILANSSLEYVTLYAIGEDSRAYLIMHDEVHWRSTRMACAHFNFNSVNLDIATER